MVGNIAHHALCRDWSHDWFPVRWSVRHVKKPRSTNLQYVFTTGVTSKRGARFNIKTVLPIQEFPMWRENGHGLGQNCINSIAWAMELLQFCTKQLILFPHREFLYWSHSIFMMKTDSRLSWKITKSQTDVDSMFISVQISLFHLICSILDNCFNVLHQLNHLYKL